MISCLLLITACVSTSPGGPIKVYCPVANKPVLIPIDCNWDFCDVDNMKVVLTNFNELTAYTKNLESTIKCYEKTELVK